MKCHLCRNEIESPDWVERINPPPWDELIACSNCYEWQAWKLCSPEQIQKALNEENVGRSSNW